MTKNRPDIFTYLDYRKYLIDIFNFKKKECSGFSFRTFSRLAGLKSSNFLRLVMDEKRNLSLTTIHSFSKALKHNRQETSFFENLVLFGQAKNLEDKNRYFEKLTQFRKYQNVKLLESHQYDYFTRWYYVAFRELVKLPDFKEQIAWINQKLGLHLTEQDMKKTIEVLLQLGLIKRNTLGDLIQTNGNLSTPPELASLAVLNFHKQMISKASQSLEESKTNHRDISSLTLAISKQKYERIRERLREFRRELHAIVGEEENPQAVYQINFQLFNLSEVPWE